MVLSLMVYLVELNSAGEVSDVAHLKLSSLGRNTHSCRELWVHFEERGSIRERDRRERPHCTHVIDLDQRVDDQGALSFRKPASYNQIS